MDIVTSSAADAGVVRIMKEQLYEFQAFVKRTNVSTMDR